MKLVQTTLSADTLHFRAPTTRHGLLQALRDDPAVGEALTSALIAAPFAAFCWETPPLTRDTADREAEFVLVDSPALARVTADPSPFGGPLAGRAGPVATFENLGRDAILVVPHPRAAARAAHLAEFVRTATPAVVAALWQAVGEAALAPGPSPLWVSTAGLGVSWLHVRLDARPKYYRHRPYTARP